MIAHLVAQIRHITSAQPSAGASHTGNWPASATFAVEYDLHDKQFPQVKHERECVYFDDVFALERFLEEKREWIKGTDYDFSMSYTVWEWDLGPFVKYAKSM